jgi:hypothetical protein
MARALQFDRSKKTNFIEKNLGVEQFLSWTNL